MSEFSPGGGFRLPKDADVQAEHQRDMREEAEHSHAEAERASEAARPRPWWAFWRPRR